MVARANWSGQIITTTTNPQRLAPANPNRIGWRVYSLDANAITGKLGYNNNPLLAYIPMPPNIGYPTTNDDPVETNELWFHGPIGSTVGIGEA